MTSTEQRHQVNLDNGPLGGRRTSYRPCCSCGWVSVETYRNQVAAAEAAVAHRNTSA